MRVFSFLALIFLVFSCHLSKPGPKNLDHFATSNPVLLISIDGYRYDYTDKFKPPFISNLLKEGMSSAESLIPVYPSLTYPNHQSIITGQYPQSHGVVGNFFFSRERGKSFKYNRREDNLDKNWFLGKPFWSFARENKIQTATCMWPGSDVSDPSERAHYFWNYTEAVSNKEKVDQIISWLQLPYEQRPQFLTLYFPEVDHAGHKHGPDSTAMEKAVLEVDKSLAYLWQQNIKLNLNLNMIILSDHGMAPLSPLKPIYLNDYIDSSKISIHGSGTLAHIYSDVKADLQEAYTNLKKIPHTKTYRKSEIPSEFGLKQSERTGDIIILAEAPYYLLLSNKESSHSKGTHGYDPASHRSMHGIFYAVGPNINKGISIKSFENIHVFPFMAQLLGLPIKHKIDGRAEVLQSLIKK